MRRVWAEIWRGREMARISALGLSMSSSVALVVTHDLINIESKRFFFGDSVRSGWNLGWVV